MEECTSQEKFKTNLQREATRNPEDVRLQHRAQNYAMPRCQELEELFPNDMLDFSLKRGLLRGIVRQEAASIARKRAFNNGSRMLPAMVALPTESWAQPRPSKRFRPALKKRERQS